MTAIPAHYDDGDVSVTVADARDYLTSVPAASVDALVTDPPYGLSDPPTPETVLTAWREGSQPQIVGGGFAGNKWDEFVPPPSTWKAAATACKPGALGAVFASARTMDWMALSLQMGGWTLIDIWHWVYSEGMPTGMNVGRALAKSVNPDHQQTAAAFTGWSTKLKPAHEPILIVSNGQTYPSTFTARHELLYRPKAKTAERPTGWTPTCGHHPDPYSPAAVVEDVFSATARACTECAQQWAEYQHPTVKPVSVIAALITAVARPGDLIVDPYAGTGPTGTAAILEHRRAALCDSSPLHVGLADRRLRKSLQATLFAGVA